MNVAAATQPSDRDAAYVVKATLDDLETIAALHLEHFSSNDNLSVLLGPAFVTAAYRWFLTSPEAFVLVARSDGEMVGFTSVAERPYTAPLIRAGWRQAALSLGRRPWLLFHREVLNRISRWIMRRPAVPLRGAAQVAFTVVLPQSRGMGIGSKLKKASIDECRRRGKRAMVTGVRRNNLPSRRMNEQAGFSEVEASGDKDYCYYVLRFP